MSISTDAWALYVNASFHFSSEYFELVALPLSYTTSYHTYHGALYDGRTYSEGREVRDGLPVRTSNQRPSKQAEPCLDEPKLYAPADVSVEITGR